MAYPTGSGLPAKGGGQPGADSVPGAGPRGGGAADTVVVDRRRAARRKPGQWAVANVPPGELKG